MTALVERMEPTGDIQRKLSGLSRTPLDHLQPMRPHRRRNILRRALSNNFQ